MSVSKSERSTKFSSLPNAIYSFNHYKTDPQTFFFSSTHKYSFILSSWLFVKLWLETNIKLFEIRSYQKFRAFLKIRILDGAVFHIWFNYHNSKKIVFALKKGRTEPIKFGRKEKNDHEYRWDSSKFNQMGKVGAPEQKWDEWMTE